MKDELSKIADKVESRLGDFFESHCFQTRTGVFPKPLKTALHDQIADLTLRGGKRIRAALVVCGANLFEEKSERRACVIDAASALEILHTYFLIHDDIMDEDVQRRGKAAVHVALQEGSDPKTGRDLGILAGDLACSMHEWLLANMDIEPTRRELVAKLFCEMHMDVVHGQTLDILATAAPLDIVLRKTASYTTVGPLTIGAALSGATGEHLLRLGKIARPLGLAFQYRDDLLGIFGKSNTTGKPVGTDLKKGKHTFLIKAALEDASKNGKKILNEILNDEQATPAQLDKAIRVIVDSGAKQKCEDMIDSLVEESQTLVEKEQYLEQGTLFLTWLSKKIARRNV